MHLHKDVAECGISLKIVTPENINNHPIEYAHRDDYYILGIITRGTICIDVDFEQQKVNKGEIGLIRPGQIHRFVGGDNFKGLMLSIERSMVSDRYKVIFEEASFSGNSVELSNAELHELELLYSLIYDVVAREEDTSVIRNLASAFIGIIAGKFIRVNQLESMYNSRFTEIILRLNNLLDTQIAESHSPTFYADKLSLTPTYLNKVVKSATGWNTGNYIRNEIIIRAKRLLYHTNLPVKEIASSLGFEDNAYFTRLFTKAAGKSPLQFRKKTK